jgi:hypothetical protein
MRKRSLESERTFIAPTSSAPSNSKISMRIDCSRAGIGPGNENQRTDSQNGVRGLNGRTARHHILCRCLVYERLESLVSEFRFFRVRVLIQID